MMEVPKITPETAKKAAMSLRNKIKQNQSETQSESSQIECSMTPASVALTDGQSPLPPHTPERTATVNELIDMSREQFLNLSLYSVVCEEAAVIFLDACSIQPTDETVQQLVEAFLPALAIISERGYSPSGANWRRMGWRGLLIEISKRWERIRFNEWERGRQDRNNTVDAINYLGYLLRHDRTPAHAEWGTIGKPGE